MSNKPFNPFGPNDFTDPQPPEFYECGICGHMHPINWNGDCRDDANRFTYDELDAKYGEDNWQEVDMPGWDDDENEAA